MGLAAVIGFQLDETQFQQVESLTNAVKRMTEAVTRLAPPLVRLRITHRKSGFTIEGANLKMNLKNNHELDVELVFTNAQGGPAAIDEGSIQWSASTSTGAFTVEPNATDPKRALLKGNPQSTGGPDDIGVVAVDFDGDAGEGTLPRHGEGAVNVIPGDAEIFEVRAVGESRPQATTTATP